jgi:hypothetical protein
VSSFIDGIVAKWKQEDPRLNASQVELNKLLSIASKLKEQLLNPSNELTPETSSSIHSNGTFNLPSGRGAPKKPVERRLVANSTIHANSTLAKAREIVRLAQIEADARNLERLNNPRLNSYFAKDANPHPQMKRAMAAELFPVSDTIAAAAALVAEADAALDNTPSESELYVAARSKKRALRSFWLGGMEKSGKWPYGGSANANYKVFRNVKDYGAVGDGRTDDTAAINRAMQEGSR